jgi:putative glutamine amidotransferase
MQWMNVYLGGELYLDLPLENPSSINHSQFGKTDVHWVVKTHSKSRIFKALKTKKVLVNSSHHQGIKTLGHSFIAVGKSSDNLIEAIEFIPSKQWNAFGVQWHPERLKNEESLRLLNLLLKEL